jgi:hypothetical protein
MAFHSSASSNERVRQVKFGNSQNCAVCVSTACGSGRVRSQNCLEPIPKPKEQTEEKTIATRRHKKSQKRVSNQLFFPFVSFCAFSWQFFLGFRDRLLVTDPPATAGGTDTYLPNFAWRTPNEQTLSKVFSMKAKIQIWSSVFLFEVLNSFPFGER